MQCLVWWGLHCLFFGMAPHPSLERHLIALTFPIWQNGLPSSCLAFGHEYIWTIYIAHKNISSCFTSPSGNQTECKEGRGFERESVSLLSVCMIINQSMWALNGSQIWWNQWAINNLTSSMIIIIGSWISWTSQIIRRGNFSLMLEWDIRITIPKEKWCMEIFFHHFLVSWNRQKH